MKFKVGDKITHSHGSKMVYEVSEVKGDLFKLKGFGIEWFKNNFDYFRKLTKLEQVLK